jgi:hypothetical protein
MNRPNLNGKVIVSEKLTPESIEKLRELGYVVILKSNKAKGRPKAKSSAPNYGKVIKYVDKVVEKHPIIVCTKQHANE